MDLKFDAFATINFLQGDLAKNVEVGTVQGSAEHPVNPWVVWVKKSLGGNTVRNEPHTQEEEEEENVLHLFSRSRNVFSSSYRAMSMSIT